jgi:mRNA-capping enzyme
MGTNSLNLKEMVIDEVGDQKFPRYLVYDIVRFEGEEVGQTNFSTRLLCIDKELVQTRARAMEEGKIDKKKEPFGIRAKQFWSLSETRTLLGPKFTKASLGHEPDGLVFQPSDEVSIFCIISLRICCALKGAVQVYILLLAVHSWSRRQNP